MSDQVPAAGALSADFRALFDATPTPLLVIAPPDWTIVAANDARVRVTGTTRQEQIGRRLFEVFPDDPNDPAADGVRNLSASLDRVLATCADDVMPVQRYAVRDADGHFEERWWSPVNAPVLGADGKVAFVIHRVEEVTEIVRLRNNAEMTSQLARDQQSVIDRLHTTQAGLRESEEFNRRILQASPDCIKVLDLDGRLEFMSEGGMCVMEVDDFGAITGACWPDFWQGEEHAKAVAAVEEAKRGGTGRFQGFATTFKGSPRWWDVAVSSINGADGHPERLLSVSRDVTEAKRADDQLRESEVRLRLATEHAEVGFWDVDVINDVLIWPPRVKAMFGISADVPVTMQDFYDGLHPDDREMTSAAFAASADPERRALYDVEYRTIGKEDGIVRWVAAKGRGVFDERGRCLRVIGTAIDITARKRIEQQLRDLNDTLEQRVAAATADLDRVWSNASDMFVVIDTNGVFKRVNPATTALLGWTEKEMVGRPVFDFVLPNDTAPTRGALEHARTSVLPSFENRYRTKDGGQRTIAWLASPEGELIYAYGRDVTAEREREAELEGAREALRQSQKMEAVGQLTGGIAHDFNNMLAVVIGSLDLLNRRIGAGDARAKRYVDAATDGARRAATLTQRLLAFSRQQPLKPEAIDVNKLVTGMSDLLRHSLGGDIRMETVLAGGGWRTHADPNQLENVLLNLAVNARDAMPEGGRLTIETQNAHLDARYAAAHLGVPAGQYVLIAVTDTGSGMPAEVIAKAFDPFFTTKEVGKGTGLGLSQVYGFVKQSGGHVKIYSEPGQGTTVKVYLPRLVGAELDADEDEARENVPLGDSQEVVLVVEDEPAVRQFSIDALTELGYRVLEADSASAALRMLEAHPEIVLMFTDIVMPEVNGAKLAEEALRRRPDLKVLFTTGYTRNAVVHNGVLDPGVELIGKPFTIEELAAKVRDVLDAPSLQT